MEPSAAARRFRLALDMFEMGERMYRERLKRSQPHAPPEAIEAEVRAWLSRRPGAEFGDYPGPPSERFT